MMFDDGNVLVCRCEEVTKADIEQAIEEGLTTVNEIKRRTRAGMGLCQGRTCTRIIARILAEKTGQSLEDILPPTRRMPVRPVEMALFQEEQSE